MIYEFPLHSEEYLTQQVLSIGITDWNSLLEHIANLPYGRTSDKTNFDLVLTEGKGSCSSKHALLKKVADENQIPGIQLILGMYTMNKRNTPGIGSAIPPILINGIPEAHCYLIIDGKRTDLTSKESDFEKIENDLLEEIEIAPSQISEFKLNYHQNFLRNWLKQQKLEMTLIELWEIREQCILNLSN